ncbi:MAG: hypothetical protein Q9164_004310 [Protoblastenia rupestris]
MIHAQNDILATVGVCAKVDGSRQSRLAIDKARVDVVKSENESGLVVSTVDATAMALSEPWALGLRQRLQAFRFLSIVPLATIVRSESKVWRPMRFLFAGAPASWAFYVGEYSKAEVAMILYYYGSVNILQLMKNPGEPRKLKGPSLRLLIMSIKLASFVLLAPFEVYATLQRLGIVPFWPILPYPTWYRSTLSGLLRGPDLPQSLCWSTALLYARSIVSTPLFVFAAISYMKPVVAQTLYRYLRASLPKPTHPDRYSLQGAHEDELDDGTIVGLINEDETDDRECTSVIDVLAKDLQAIGRNWQIFRNGCSDLVSGSVDWLSGRPEPSVEASRSSSSSSTVPPLPSDLRETMEAMTELIDNEDSLPPPPESVPGLRPGLQDLLDPIPHTTGHNDLAARRLHGLSTPQASPLRFPSSDSDFPISPRNQSPYADAPPTTQPATPRNQSPPRHDSSSSSISPSRLSTPPPPIEISTSTARTGTLHMNVTIPTDITNTHSEPSRGFQAPPPGSSDSDSSDGDDEEPRPYHRVTTLTAHAAEAMAQHLSYQIAELLFLPLEALFVRSVALTFWTAPGLLMNSRGAAGRWTGDLYPLGSWFGMGLRAGGWRGVGDYAGKMFLVWGLQVGMGFAVWEMSTGLMWLAGLKWYDWTKL